MAKNKTSFVFFVGDDGVIVSHIIGKKVMRKIFLSSSDADSMVALKDLTDKDPKAPISILLDSIDQSYQTQSFPPVAKMSVQKLVNKKLERDFAAGDITTSLPLGKEKEGRQDWKFLLISIVPSPTLMQWVDYILELENPFKGIYLVPVESEILIKNLIGKKPKDEKQSVWHMLVLHNKVSGFRQVITKNGRLTFTRLTQANTGDNAPLVIAGNIEQELVSTIEYLKRLSYREDEGLDITVIASPQIVEAIDSNKIGTHNNANFITPSQAAEKLGFDEDDYSDNHFTDIIFSAAFSNNRKKVLPLHSELSKKISLFQKSVSAVKAAAILLCLLIVLGMVYFAYLWYSSLSSAAPIESSIDRNQKLISGITQEAETLPKNIKKIENSVYIYQTFADQKHVPIDFVKQLIEVSQNGTLVKNISWKSSNSFADRASKKQDTITIEVAVNLLETARTSEARIELVNEYLEALRNKFPEFEITHNDIEGTLYERGKLAVDFTSSASRTLAQTPINFNISFSIAPPNTRGRR